MPLARLDADGEQTEQGGLGTTQDAALQQSADTAPETREAGAYAQGAAANTSAANDSLEAQYWAALSPINTPASTLGNGTTGQAELCKVYYFHTDQVGMPQELTNAQGQLVWQASYKTWGSTVAEEWEVKSLSGDAVHPLDAGDSPRKTEQQQNLRFQGQYLDRDTGLHYNTFRYYDPDMGRFICPDPIGLLGGFNLGSYAPNPISWIDPWGWAIVDATFEMGGEVFPGTNPTDRGTVAERPKGPTVPGTVGPNRDTSSMHAEIDAMMKAKNAGLRGGTGTLIVEGLPVCDYCRRSIKNMAKALGLDTLIVIEKSTGNVYTWSGIDFNAMKMGGLGWKDQLPKKC